MKKSHYAAHQDLLSLIQLRGQKEFKSLRLFPTTVGLFYTRRGTPVKIGTNGIPDLAGFIGPFAIYVEVKSGKQLIKKGSDQDNFMKMCEKFNVIHIVATSPDQFVKTLKEKLNRINLNLEGLKRSLQDEL